MYGMVNEAMQQMITSLHGEATWQHIRAQVGCDLEHFIRLDAYPDELTYGLVGAAVAELRVPAPELLHEFGRYWVSFARHGGYGDFFRACATYEAFLVQLDAMHARLQLSFPGLRAPQFTCAIESPTSLRVVYQSHREGLAPFVAGLLEGLGEPFNVEAKVQHLHGRAPGTAGAEDHFRVTLTAR
jgi:Haem-NO-binding